MSKASEKKEPKAAKPGRAPTLYLIAGFKLLKGGVVLLVAASIFRLSGHNLGDIFDNFLRWVDLDPEKRFFAAISDQLASYTPANIKTFASWAMIYGLFMFSSGVGLALRAAWAIWLAIGESAFFIPIEIFEIVRRHPANSEIAPHRIMAHPKIGLTIVLIVNVTIVWYLFRNRNRLFRHHH